MRKLDDKVALVTGSGRGIGRAIALKLAEEGARVVVNDLDAAPAHQTIELMKQSGADAVACIGSVTEFQFGERFVQTALDSYGGLDIIVNNAGYTWDSVIQKISDEQRRLQHVTFPAVRIRQRNRTQLLHRREPVIACNYPDRDLRSYLYSLT